jgi:hypothetical protein
MTGNPHFRSRAVRAMVLLHEEELRRFMDTWRLALKHSVKLPASDDPAYVSLATLGRHVLWAAGGYVVWICQVSGLPDPGIRAAPDADALILEPNGYLEHVLEGWRDALRELADEQLETPEYPSEWGTRYSIDAMLEHAVMHPIRHRFQLNELLEQQGRGRQFSVGFST